MSHTKTVDLDEVEWLLSFHMPAARICHLLGFQHGSILKAAHKAGREDIAARLDRSWDDGGISINRVDVYGESNRYRPRQKSNA